MRILALCVVLAVGQVFAEDVFKPAENITTDGIPAVPRELVEKIDRYGNSRSTVFAQWHPERLEMLIATRFGDTN